MSVSPFEHPYLSSLLGDDEIQAFFSAQADIAAMVGFERALTAAQGAVGMVPQSVADQIVTMLDGFVPDLEQLAWGTARDGVVVPDLVTQLRRAVGGEAATSVHLGATSQDVIDTSFAMRANAAGAALDQRLAAIIAGLDALSERFGTTVLAGHTRMQIARPITVAHKIAEWRAPLARYRDKRPDPLPLQLGGAVGNRAELGDYAQAVADHMAASLGLPQALRARHTERDGIADLAHWLSLMTATLGKMGQDVALMAQNEVGQVTVSGGGTSSAMPGKANPVAAEVLVTLARFNATLIAGVHSAMVHENERSGAAWTLEWMLVPQMFAATGAALRTGLALVQNLSFNPAR